MFLLQAAVPKCFKTVIIVPVSMSVATKDLTNFCQVALTSIVIKCLKKLVQTQSHTQKNIIPATFDHHRYANCGNRSRENLTLSALHISFTHLKHQSLHITHIVYWLQSIIQCTDPHQTGLQPGPQPTPLHMNHALSDRPQDSTLILNTSNPQGCEDFEDYLYVP